MFRTVRSTLGVAALFGALAGVGTLLYLNRGDPDGSARLANAEIDAILQRGETIEERVNVQQRRWYDYFRITHGVLAATDRRLIYVGVPPEELLKREVEPRELDEAVFAYDRPLAISPTRVFFGAFPGVVLRGSGRAVSLGVSSRTKPRLDSVVAVVNRRQDELRAAADAERRAMDAAAAASRRALYHLVQPGDALDRIAARYGTVVDSLRVWNGLTDDRITAGRRLLVRPERR